MKSLGCDLCRLVVMTALVLAALPVSTVCAGDGPSDSSLRQLLKNARKDVELRDSLRIEVEGFVDKEQHQLAIYGRGIGIWNAEGQFTLKSTNVVAAIDLLLDAKFYSMPERFAYEENDDNEEKPVQLLRVVTVTVGGHSKTVIQDSKGPTSQAFAKLTADLVSLCRKPAQTLVGAANLTDGLDKVASGTLAPETLMVSVNAPELRSLQSQEGQGWQLAIRHARVVLTSVTIVHGVKQVGEMALDEAEARKLASDLLAARVADLPSNVNTTGYTQLTVAVLNQSVRTLARSFAGKPDENAKETAASFARVREMLHTMYETGVKARTAD